MANTKQEVFIPRTGDALDAGLYVCVNGEAFLLPRGKTSRVPGYIAAEIARSEHAREQQEQTAKSMRGKDGTP
jgi:hypothetical protein